MKLLVLLGIVVIVAGVLLMSGCKEETLNGKNVREIFSDQVVQALAVAAAKGDVTAVNKLVEAGANVNETGLEGATPLVWAWGHQSRIGMEALLKKGANPNIVFSDMDFIDFTVDEKTTDNLELILKYGAKPDGISKGSSPIHYAIDLGNHKHLKIILNHGGSINAQDSHGDTPLVNCLYIRQMDLAKWLIEQGADINTMSNYGGTVAWEIHDSLESETYSPEAKEKALVIKQMLIDRDVKWPPLSPEENRKKFGLPDPE